VPTQQELDAIWQKAKDGEYGNNSGVIKPEVVVDDESEQVLSIPNQDGSARDVYRRKPGHEWEAAPFVGETHEYR
jgi:hypothetical protein